jgi:hypothetical protein
LIFKNKIMKRFGFLILIGFVFTLINCDNKDKPTVAKVETISITNITNEGATLNGEIVSEEGSSAYKRGFVWSTTTNPTTDNTTSDNGSGVGTFSFQLSKLPSKTTYYVKAYAINAYGTSYGKEMNFTTLSGIGDTAGGGIIFYLDGTGGGLVVAATDQSSGCKWGCVGTAISGTSAMFGSGKANTTAITTVCTEAGIAAKVCSNLVLNGYDDWYLPSKEELNTIYTALHKNGKGSFGNTYYWTSTEFNASNAWYQNFNDGDQSTASKSGNTIRVRAIRALK